jgi:hypothetical protein
MFEYFFLICHLKMDRFLLNSNERCESGNKEGISSTSGKGVKKRKNRKYDDSNLDLVLRRQKSMAKRGRIVFCV